MQAFEAGRSHGHRRSQLAHLHFRVGDDDIGQVEFPVQPLRPGGVGAVGDALHLFEDFAIEAAQEKRIGGGAIRIPCLLVGLAREVEGAALQIFGNLPRHQPAVLIAALVRLPFDMQIDPAGRRIAVCRAERLHGIAGGPTVGGRRLVEADAFKPGFPRERAAAACGQQDLVPRAGRHETQ